MKSTFHIARFRGVPIGIHWSWFFVFAMVTASLAMVYLPREYADLTPRVLWSLAAVTALLFFGSVLLHELGHTVVARRKGVAVKEISLFLFGGVAKMDREPRTAWAELQIALAGPAVSLALAGAAFALYRLDLHAWLEAPLLWLARINAIVAVFNLVPGFPLDGGRVLRAIVWRITGSLQRATRLAAATGQGVAILFIAFGLVQVFAGEPANGLWWVLIGWFLQTAAAASAAHAEVHDVLDHEPVSRAMDRQWQRVSPGMSLREFADEHVLARGARFFIVMDGDEPKGTISLSDLKRNPRAEWPRLSVQTAMTGWTYVSRIEPDASMLDALHLMDDAEVSQLPVEWRGRIVGVISREQVLRYVRLRMDLGLTEREEDRPSLEAA